MAYCDYICMVGKPRPCPAGDGCKVRMVNGVPDDEALRKLTAEEKAARRKEQVRVNARRYYEKHREECKAKIRNYNMAHREEINRKNRERMRKKREEARKNG